MQTNTQHSHVGVGCQSPWKPRGRSEAQRFAYHQKTATADANWAIRLAPQMRAQPLEKVTAVVQSRFDGRRIVFGDLDYESRLLRRRGQRVC